jgi:xylulokinase
MDHYILTYDIGTTGNKCSLFNDKGFSIYSKTIPYTTLYPKPGWAEQKPEDFWESVVTGTKILFEETKINPSAISVIGLSGHMNGCIPIDVNGNILYNDILHSDSRSIAECREISQIFDNMAYYRLTGIRLSPHYTLSKILWLKSNYPDVYKNTAFFIASKDYVAYKLTGNLGITDYSDASMTGLFNIQKKYWSDDLTRELDIELKKLPDVKKSYEIAGYVTKEAAALTGLVQGIPVVIGGGDGSCAAKGAGVTEKLQAYNYIGSSSWISVLNNEPIFDETARIFCYYDLDGESFNVTGTVQCASISYDWVLNNIAKSELKECRKNRSNVFDYIDSLAEKVPVGSNGVFFIPYFMGERSPIWDENTKGGFIGITLFNKREELFRATYEGIAFALKSVLKVFEENGLSPEQINLIGGGAISPLWNEIMCNVYGKKLKIHKYPREATSLGAAMAAGVGAGIFKDFNFAASFIEFNRQIESNPQIVEKYDKCYEVFSMFYPRLKPIYERISELHSILSK